MVFHCADVSSLSTLEHRHDCFNLTSFSVGIVIEANLHEPSVVPLRRLGRRAAMHWWDNRADATSRAGVDVIRLRVIPTVRNDRRHAHALERVIEQGLELGNVRFRSTMRAVGKYEVRRNIAHDRQFRKTVVNHLFPGSAHLGTTTDEVAAGHRAFETSRVDRRTSDLSATSKLQSNRLIEQLASKATDQQPLRRFLQGRVMRDMLQPEDLPQVGTVGQAGTDTPIIGLEKVFEYQAGKQLMLRELFGTAAMRVGRQRTLGDHQSGPHDSKR